MAKGGSVKDRLKKRAQEASKRKNETIAKKEVATEEFLVTVSVR